MKTQILKMLVDNEVNPLNLSVKTIKELAYSIAENSIIKNRLTLIEFRDITDVITDLLKALQSKGSLCFFDKIEITFGISTAISKTLLELLDSGYLHGYVSLEKIENINKRKDLETIIAEYVAWKKANDCIDHTDVADMAYESFEQQQSEYVSGYALQSCEFTVLDERIIKKLDFRTENVESRNMSALSLSLQAEQVRFF
jgi:hypothetical protein